MTAHSLDVIGIGNAIVDVIASADDAFLAAHDMTKGAMMLVDEERARELYTLMGPTVVSSGGSAGNTVAGIASLGGRAGYIGKVHADGFGKEFRHDIIAAGVTYDVAPASDGPGTARCLILVTPDSQRTMNTYLGACVNLGPDDIDPDFIRSAQVTYLEGYLYDPPLAQAAFRKAADIAHAAGRRVSLSLSDPFCVHRHRDAFHELIALHVDVLFANEIEIKALFECDDVATAIERVRKVTDIASITLGPQGSLVITPDGAIEVAAIDLAPRVDTTGAGDLYAAGFLHGMTTGASLTECARIGTLAAAEVITHLGGRPQRPLHALVAEHRVRA